MEVKDVRTEILASFTASEEEYLSGGELAERLGISRTAIWKQMNALRELGYVFEAAPRKGYRLVERPDRLYPWEIAAHLAPTHLRFETEYHERIGSTNDRAKALAASGAPEGQLVVAEEQSTGRGRRGRGWVSPFGEGIFASLVLRPPISPFEAPRLTLVAAVAVCWAIREVCGLEAGLKWPNDVQVEGRKVCGILVEMGAEMESVNYVVIGTGINANVRPESFEPELRSTAGSLRQFVGSAVDRVALLAAYLQAFDALYAEGVKEHFAQALHEARALSTTLGKPIRVYESEGEWDGIARQIGDDGALIVETTDGRIRRLLSGEVSVRHE